MAAVYAKNKPEGFSNRIERVALVGAGGRIGGHIAQALISNGKHEITLISRPDSQTKLPEGPRIVKVDYSGDDLTQLVAALRGQQCLIVCMAVAAPRGTLSKFIRAAAQAQVPYIMPNWFGIDPESEERNDIVLIKESQDAMMAEIKELGVSSYLLLGCQFWYEFSLGGGPNRYGFDFVKRSVIFFDRGEMPINTTSWPQCGRAVAAVLSLKELPEDEQDKSTTLSQFANNAIRITSFRLTQKDMLESVKRVTKTTDADWTITHESGQERFDESKSKLQDGDWTVFTKLLYSCCLMKNRSDMVFRGVKLDNEALGLPVEDLDEATAEAVRLGLAGEVDFGG